MDRHWTDDASDLKDFTLGLCADDYIKACSLLAFTLSLLTASMVRAKTIKPEIASVVGNEVKSLIDEFISIETTNKDAY